MNVEGSLEVDGVIEGAIVNAGKDIVVHQGIHGMDKAVIKAGGSLTTNFIEEAEVTVGLNQMILRSSDDKRILEYASDINSSGENLKEIINKILDLSKIESGKMEIINVSYSTV